MGGHAFDGPAEDDRPAIKIVRIPTPIYTQLQCGLAKILQRYYRHVTSPRETPEKTDHGDIDFLVQGPLNNSAPTADDLATALQATRYKPNSPTTNFAVPLSGVSATADSSRDPPPHVQVDVHVCRDNIHWLSFMHSDGDVWQILGGVIRPYGLTATDDGLHVRIEEGEQRDRKASRLFLSAEPEAVTLFLGLDWEAHEKGFASVQDAFEWVAGCRLFDARAFAVREDNANDRRRMKQRPVFARFVEQFVPMLLDQGRGYLDAKLSREQVLGQALDTFAMREEYGIRLARIKDAESEARANKLVLAEMEATGLTQDKANLTVRAIKRWTTKTLVEDGTTYQLVLRADAEMRIDDQMKLGKLLDDSGEKLTVQARDWLLANREELKRREQKRVKKAKVERAACSPGDAERAERRCE